MAVACAFSQTVAHRPYLQNVTAESAVVIWATTGSGGTGEVRFGEVPQVDNRQASTVRAFSPEETGLAETLYVSCTD